MDYETVDELFESEDMMAPDNYECSCPSQGCWAGHEDQAVSGPDGMFLCPFCNSPVAYACEIIPSEMEITDGDGEYDEPVMAG